MTNNCATVAPGKSLKFWQKTGLELVARLHRGRDVAIAIDLTESVGLNDEGRLRLTQIVKDSLQSGDTVYVVPFASEVNPLAPNINPISSENAIAFRGKAEDIEQILQAVPFQSALTLSNTDIQNAELYIYQGLAQLNQCRLADNKTIKPQSVVWLTDAPLLTQPGITSEVWVETPAESPFRRQDSEASQARQGWLEALPLQKRSQQITTNDNRIYQLTVVDLAPTVQEFCTPAPGGKSTCLITPYLIKQLWLPTLILALAIFTGAFCLKYLLSLNQKWKLKITFESDDDREEQICYLRNQEKIAIGDDALNSINCPGTEIRAYLKRKGNQLYLEPTRAAPIFYREQEITKPQKIDSSYIRINCPEPNFERRDFEIIIKLIK